MTRRYLKLAIAGCLFTLTACAQQSEIRQMHQSVSTLSQEMTQLNQQTIKITQQNALNAKSTRGVYLLPERPRRWRARSAPCACRWAVLPRMAMGHA
ncbi:putative lipoprotein YajI [Klebsiella pneumoniae]|nr:putative lipoprotein YajI [Klebsiella pneumoniae]